MRPYWDETHETMPGAQMEQLQLRYLQTTLARVYERVPFYRKAFDAQGVNVFPVAGSTVKLLPSAV